MSASCNDRAAGAVLAAACGDALGAGRAPGEWTGATAMAVPILQAAAAGEALTHEATHDAVVARWVAERRDAEDVGEHTAAVLRGPRELTAQAARASAKALHDRTGRSGGTGSLVRTAAVALPFVNDATDVGLVRTARAIGGLTDVDPDAGDACVLWSAAIRHAIRHGAFGLRGGVALLPAERCDRWSALIDRAEERRPGDLPGEDGVVAAFQAAWRAIATTPVPAEVPARHLRLALEAAVRDGHDGAVAAIAGGLLGARWGASAVPAEWRRILHGRPGLDARALTRLAVLALNGGLGDGTGWPAVDRVRPSGARVLVAHPHDDGVLLGSLRALDDLPADVDAVVSLCRTGRAQIGGARTDREQVEFWLIDQEGRSPNLDLVLRDAADTVAALRTEGRRVLVHCAEGRSRTPAVGALYAALHLGVPADRALTEVAAALPEGAPQPFLQEAVRRIAAPAAGRDPVTAPVPPADGTRPVGRRMLYVDLDGTVMDVASGIARLPATARATYEGRHTDAPGIFALMAPVPGAVEAFRELARHFDAYLLTTAPWDDPSAWQHKVEWVQLHFGRAAEEGGEPNPAYRRLILSPAGSLRPDGVLIGAEHDDDAFEGERIRFGGPELPDWPAVVAHLVPPASPPAPPAPAPPAREPLRDLTRRQARRATRSAAELREDQRRFGA